MGARQSIVISAGTIKTNGVYTHTTIRDFVRSQIRGLTYNEQVASRTA